VHVRSEVDALGGGGGSGDSDGGGHCGQRKDVCGVGERIGEYYLGQQRRCGAKRGGSPCVERMIGASGTAARAGSRAAATACSAGRWWWAVAGGFEDGDGLFISIGAYKVGAPARRRCSRPSAPGRWRWETPTPKSRRMTTAPLFLFRFRRDNRSGAVASARVAHVQQRSRSGARRGGPRAKACSNLRRSGSLARPSITRHCLSALSRTSDP
jgi:hypothetical protein